LGKVIAICNQKGGVAKTTTAVNLSSYLATEGRKILLIDLDPQSNSTSGIGIDKQNVKTSIYNIMNGQMAIQDIIIETQVDNLHIVPSSLELTGAEVELVNLMSREYRLARALEVIRNEYEFIVIDCPPSLGLLTINALTAANSIIIPIQCEYYALEGLSQLMNTINLIKDNLNRELEIEGVLLTMADFRTKLTKEVIDEVKRHFGNKVYRTVIPRTIKLTEAPGFGKPIVLYDKNSMGAKCYSNLAREVLGKSAQPIDNNIVMQEEMVEVNKEEKEYGEEVR